MVLPQKIPGTCVWFPEFYFWRSGWFPVLKKACFRMVRQGTGFLTG